MTTVVSTAYSRLPKVSLSKKLEWTRSGISMIHFICDFCRFQRPLVKAFVSGVLIFNESLTNESLTKAGAHWIAVLVIVFLILL